MGNKDSKSSLTLFDEYELTVAYENLRLLNVKYETEKRCVDVFNYSIEKLMNIDSGRNFKNFYKQFSIEDDNNNTDRQGNVQKTSSGDPKIDTNNPDPKKAKVVKETKMKKFAEMVKSKSKEFYKAITRFFNKVINTITNKRIRSRLVKAQEMLKTGNDLEKIKEEMTAANYLAIANLSSWVCRFSYKVTVLNADNYVSLKDDELGGCSDALKQFGETTKKLVEKMEKLKTVKKYDEAAVTLKELRNFLKTFHMDGNSKIALGDDGNELIQSLEGYINDSDELLKNYQNFQHYNNIIDKILKEADGDSILPLDKNAQKEFNTKLDKITQSNIEGPKSVFVSNLMGFSWNFAKSTQMMANYLINFLDELKKCVEKKDKEEVKEDKDKLKAEKDVEEKKIGGDNENKPDTN